MQRRGAEQTGLRARRALIEVALLAVVGIAVPAAQGHPQLLASIPADRGAYTVSPANATLDLSEAVETDRTRVSLRMPEGTELSLTHEAVSTTRLVVPLPPLDPGVHRLSWRALSAADGHVYGGAVLFAIGNPARLGAETFEPYLAAPPEQLAAEVAGRVLHIVAVAVLLGLPVFALAVWRGSAANRSGPEAWAERRLLYLWVAGLLLALVGAALLGAGAGEPAPSERVVLGEHGAVTTERGLQAGVRIVVVAYGLLIVALEVARSALGSRTPWTWGLQATAGAGLALAASFLGHLGTRGPLAAAGDAVHFALASVWLGGVLAFAGVVFPFVQRLPEEQRAAVLSAAARRFSPIATACVAGVVLTGVLASVQLLRSPTDLWETRYGQALAVKLALFALLLSVAARTRAVASTGGAQATTRFGRAVRAEVVAGAAVLAAAGMLTVLVPSADLIEAAPRAGPEYAIFVNDSFEARATLAVNPPLVAAGSYDLDLFFEDAAGGAVDEGNVSLSLSGQQLQGVDRPHVGHYRVAGVPIEPSSEIRAEAAHGSWVFRLGA